ncbi:MAG TPA: alpha/beta hydrolase [Steroidobacteraceae bacterium]|jgi:pimeloyl-ACP methyl ester carboxylesterase
MVNPLAAFRGRRPDAPSWFSDALAIAPERSRVPVRDVNIEVLSWGERGAQGLLLLHGLGAHADWWSHLAPFLAKRYRVTALSWSGMGGSDWRESYSAEIYLEEILAAAQTSGIFESSEAPLMVGHSFGGLMLLAAAAAYGERLKGAVVVDSYLHPDGEWHLPPSSQRALPVYASLEAALARFRFSPPQACANLFIADHIARASLKPVPLQGQREPGWTWRFDPQCAGGLPRVPIAACLAKPRCPLAFIAGARSPLTNAAVESLVLGTAPKGTPWTNIPDADHHVMVDQPLALIAALFALFECWPRALPV